MKTELVQGPLSMQDHRLVVQDHRLVVQDHRLVVLDPGEVPTIWCARWWGC